MASYWIDSVTDRTMEDVLRVEELIEKGFNNFTSSEVAEWNNGLKGAFNISDMTRIVDNINLLCDVLELDCKVNDGRNIFNPTTGETTVYGITYKPLDDKTYMLSGKCTASSGAFTALGSLVLEPGKYILSGYDNSVGTFDGVYMAVRAGSASGTQLVSTTLENGKMFNVTERVTAYVGMRIHANMGTVSNMHIKPMLRYNDASSGNAFLPYNGTDIYLPTKSLFISILNAVQTIREAYAIHAYTPQTPSAPINTFEKLNDVESILLDVYTILMDNFNYYAGSEIYAGDETGLLL